MPGLPGKRQFALGVLLESSDPILTKPGAAGYASPLIVVPFKHRLLRAWLCASGTTDANGNMTAILSKALNGAAFTGAQVGSTMAAASFGSSTNAQVFEYTLAAADKIEQAANTVYYPTVTGGDAGDRLATPTLMLLVLPVPRTAL